MSVFCYKGSKVWTMDFAFHGQRIRETTGMTSKTRAQEIHNKRRQGLKDGIAGFRKYQQPRILIVAAAEWLDMKKTTLAPRSVKIEKASLAHLLPVLGKKSVCDIDELDIARFQKGRLDEDSSPKTINREIGTLRALTKTPARGARATKGKDAENA